MLPEVIGVLSCARGVTCRILSCYRSCKLGASAVWWFVARVTITLVKCRAALRFLFSGEGYPRGPRVFYRTDGVFSQDVKDPAWRGNFRRATVNTRMPCG